MYTQAQVVEECIGMQPGEEREFSLDAPLGELDVGYLVVQIAEARRGKAGSVTLLCPDLRKLQLKVFVRRKP